MNNDNQKPIKSLEFSDPSSLKVGDTVFLGDRTNAGGWDKDYCPLCHIPDEEEVARGELTTFRDEQCCDAHQLQMLIEEIGAKKSLRIEQWHNGDGWRAGIEWYAENDFEFICEKPTLLECLQTIKTHLT